MLLYTKHDKCILAAFIILLWLFITAFTRVSLGTIQLMLCYMHNISLWIISGFAIVLFFPFWLAYKHVICILINSVASKHDEDWNNMLDLLWGLQGHYKALLSNDYYSRSRQFLLEKRWSILPSSNGFPSLIIRKQSSLRRRARESTKHHKHGGETRDFETMRSTS